jgi:hypothetical protein
MNLTSDQSISRVGRNINIRYKRVTSSIGIDTSRQIFDVDVQTVTNDRYLGFTGIEKINFVKDITVENKPVLLTERTMIEMHNLPLTGGQARNYAVTNYGPNSVTIYVDTTIPETGFLKADGLEIAETLAGAQSPQFPESFHDILIYGAVADELKKMEKFNLAKDAEMDFERRLSDLRMFIAKTAMLDIYQGKLVNEQNWWRKKWS